ncbi:MAG: ABC transporter substrate-binding protein [Anaerolineae bacterium]
MSIKDVLTRRAFLRSSLFAGAGLTLAACTPQPAATPTDVPAPAEPTAAAAAPTTAADPTAVVEATEVVAVEPVVEGLSPDALKALKGAQKVLWWSWTPTKNDSIFAVLPGITRMYPDLNIELDRRNVEWGQYPQMVKTALTAGNAPDIIDIYEAAVSTMDLAAAGQLLDLAPYLDLDAEWKEGLIPSALQSDSWNGGQHFFTLPLSVNNVMIWYNKGLFEKAGVEVPKTFDEMKVVAQKLRDIDVQPLVFGIRDQWQVGDLYLAIAAQLAGSKMRDADMRRASWTDETLVASAQMFLAFQENGIFADGITGMSSSDANNVTFSENAAMYMNGSWGLATKDQWPEGVFDRMDVMMFPQFKENATPQAVGDYSQNGGIWAESKAKEAALAMYRFLSLDVEAQSIWIPLGEVPVTPWDTSTVEEPIMKRFVEAQPKAYTRMIYDSLANNALLSGIQGMLDGQVTPEQVMETTESSARQGEPAFIKD